jgi:hypothetical protein
MFERARRSCMNDESDVRSVDTHAECDSGDDDIRTFAEKRILMAPPLEVGEASMVGQRGMADPGKPGGERVDFPA